jgi:hypothetical protein
MRLVGWLVVVVSQVNREWNFQKKHGFRCQFDRGILQLYFNLKLERYRR